jgi:hypothetical protein
MLGAQIFENWICFRLQMKGLRLVLSTGPNRVDVCSPSPKTETYSFRNIVFPSYLEFRTMNRVQKRRDSERYTPLLELFRF